ncbi:olfactory receptor-like protein DTMT [Dendropsophus ebraccatus]|uniref:olfactory receptor-like protein DTMT n=1 Tax=Dendropsophus ebraccatus TaxID=150705 RepID=UPI003831EFDB
MDLRNQSFMSFTLLGLSEKPNLRLPLLSFFMGAYILCVMGNVLILMLISTQSQLHTPMYFFLRNLSIVDVCLTSITVPRTISSLLSQDLSISFHGCFIQLFLFYMVGNMDSFLLAIMALDRYAAICQPLHYTTIMSKRTCICLLTFSWFTVSLHSTLYTTITSTLLYCDWVIHHYFCDVPAMLLLSCTDTSVQQMVIFCSAVLIVMGPMLVILGSYVLIIRAVLKLRTSIGRRQTFSTCSSHLSVVFLFYSSIIFIYFRPSSLHSTAYDRVISVLYSVIAPMLNPFIYTLRNKEVRNAVKMVTQCVQSSGLASGVAGSSYLSGEGRSVFGLFFWQVNSWNVLSFICGSKYPRPSFLRFLCLETFDSHFNDLLIIKLLGGI